MTISSTANRWAYNGDGVTTQFAYGNKVFSGGDLKVYVDGALQIESTHYSVSGVGAETGGTVTFVTAPPSGSDNVVIVRDVPRTQGTDLPLGGVLPSTAVEDALDKLTVLVQQNADRVARALVLAESDPDGIGTLPDKVSRLGKLMRFNATTGDPEAVAAADADLVSFSPFMATLAGDNSAAAARDTLGTVGDVFSARGDLIYEGTSGETRLAIGNEGQAVVSNGSDPVWADPSRSAINKLGLSNNGTDPDHDIDIAAGSCWDADLTEPMFIASTLTKRIDASWAAGNDAGGLDSGTVAASTLYAVWLIKRTDTAGVDALFSTEFTSPTMPADYDKKRLIGAVITDASSNIISFIQSGDYFRLTGALAQDVYDTTITSNTWETAALSVPPLCLAHVYVYVFNNTAANTDDSRIFVRTKGGPEQVGNAVNAWLSVQGTQPGQVMSASGFVLVDLNRHIEYATTQGSGSATTWIRTFGFLMATRSAP